MKFGVSLAITPPLPRTRSPKSRTNSTTSGSVSPVAMISRSFSTRGGLKKCVPRKRRLKPSLRPSAIWCSGMPEVLEEIMASCLATFSTRSISSLLGSSLSRMASRIQSASATRSKSSSKLPRCKRSATFLLMRAAGRAFFIRSKPALTTSFLFAAGSSGAMSSRSTSRPALAQWAAMAAPMVPAPSTATRRIRCVIVPLPSSESPPISKIALRHGRRREMLEFEGRREGGDPLLADVTRSLGTDYYLIDELLTDEEREIRDRVRSFADKEVIPVINGYWEKAEFPFELIPKIAELNIAGGTIEGYGCPGMSHAAAMLVAIEMARGDGSLNTFFGVHSGLAMGTIDICGSEEQKEKWLPPMARCEKIGAFGLTEPNHGSDAVMLETRAKREGDEYVIDGAKRWIGNASFADVIVIWARDDEGNVGGFLVEKGTPGYSAEVIKGKTSKRAVWQADIRLEGVRIPAGNRLEYARTFKDTAKVLTATRYGVAWEAIGHAVASYEAALTYAKERVQFGKPIANFQLIQSKLANMLAEITNMQLMCLRLSQLLQEGKMTGGMASLAKMNNAKKARKVCSDARDILGGNGILLEYHVARHYSDMEAVYTYEGTDTVQSLIVGREVTGINAFA